MIFAAYYTADTPYAKVASKYLVPSAFKFYLSIFIQAIPNRGNWTMNTLYKPRFVLDTMKKYKNTVVFLDVDAEIRKYPSLFWEIPEDYDMAVHYLDWNLQWRGKPGARRELLSGTMMFRYNDRVMGLLDDYAFECSAGKTTWEQGVLQELLAGKYKDTIKIFELPPEYCTVVLHDGSIPPYIKEPVIVHHQVSRLYR